MNILEEFSASPALSASVIAAFAFDKLLSRGSPETELRQNSYYLLSHASSLALHGLSAVYRDSARPDDNSRIEDRAIATPSDYEMYLYDIGKEEQRKLIGRASLLKYFSEYSSEVDRLEAETSLMQNRAFHPTYISAGGVSEAYKVSLHDEQIVIRLPRHRDSTRRGKNVADTYGRIAAGLEMSGYPGYEQFIAGSLERAATISRYIQGKTMNNLASNELSELPDAVISTWLEDTIKAFEHKILLDEEPQNLILNPNYGIVFVDYYLASLSLSSAYRYRTSAINQISRTIHALAERGRWTFTSQGEFATRKPVLDSCNILIERCLTIVKEKLKKGGIQYRRKIQSQSASGDF